MKASLVAKQGGLHISMDGESLRGILFTWDSDTYPDQLSSSGLACIDIRENGATAFIVKNFLVQGACGDELLSCRPIVIESRVYDASDPTGQTYSASVLRRANGKVAEDLIIPFSNFNRKGLRGPGRFDCVGAISIHVQTDSYRHIDIETGAVFTNSEHPLEALTRTPTVGAEERSERENAMSPRPLVESSQPTPLASPVPTTLLMQESTSSTQSKVEKPLTRTTPSVSQVVETARPEEVKVAPQRSPEVKRVAPQEAVYGEISNQ